VLDIAPTETDVRIAAAYRRSIADHPMAGTVDIWGALRLIQGQFLSVLENGSARELTA